MHRSFFGLIIFLSFFSVVGYSQQQEPAKQKARDKEEDKDEPAKVSPVLIRGPYLQTATSHSIMIRWRTDALSRSRIWFGKEMDSLKLMADDSALVTEHKVILQNLEPLAKYYYRIGAIK